MECAICKEIRDGCQVLTIYTGDLRDTKHMNTAAYTTTTVKTYGNFKPHQYHVCPICLDKWGPDGRRMKPIGFIGIVLVVVLGGIALANHRSSVGLIAFLSLVFLGVLVVTILMRFPVLERLKRKTRKFGQLALDQEEYLQRMSMDEDRFV